MTDKDNYTLVVGLEIHVQLATKSKMFSRCSADWFGKEPNTVVCPVSLGLPGALPVPNKKAIQWAILLGKALNCSINKVSKFDRKHYFYPDLPKGYQISQYDQPFSYDGYYDLESKTTGKTRRIRIKRVHLEEDTGKLIHAGGDTLVDFNRAGVPLVEIVTEPDFDNSEDMKQFLEELQVLIRYLGISEADMEKGSMRLEPNISVIRPGESGLPDYKVEVKNINSFRFAKNAVEFEFQRHVDMLAQGETPVQETRGYNESLGQTVSQRVKESADDYRYFPEPDIPPFSFSNEFIMEIEDMLIELPHQRMRRFVESGGIDPKYAYILTRSPELAQFYEDCLIAVAGRQTLVPHLEFPNEIAKIIVNKKLPTDIPVEEFCKKALDILKPTETNSGELQTAVSKVLSENADSVASYKNGKENVLMFLVGQVMKEMRGKADAKLVIQELKRAVNESI